MSDAAEALVLSLDVNDTAASKSGFTTNGADDDKVRCLENKRQSPTRSQSPSPTSGLSDMKAQEVAEVRAAGTYHRIGWPISGPPSRITKQTKNRWYSLVPFRLVVTTTYLQVTFLRCTRSTHACPFLRFARLRIITLGVRRSQRDEFGGLDQAGRAQRCGDGHGQADLERIAR